MLKNKHHANYLAYKLSRFHGEGRAGHGLATDLRAFHAGEQRQFPPLPMAVDIVEPDLSQP